MKIRSVQATNFRTIESLRLSLHPTYTALCGANDSGKTNVVRALRSLLKGSADDERIPFSDSTEISFKDDFPKWKSPDAKNERVSVSAVLEIDQKRDAGLFQSISKQLTLDSPQNPLVINVSLSQSSGQSTQTATVETNGKDFTGLDAQEVLSRIQSSACLRLHNSTQGWPRMFFRGGSVTGIFKDLSAENQKLLGKLKINVNRSLSKIAKGRQREFEQLLGKLERKYNVGLSLPTMEFTDLPYGITLGEPKFQVRLDEWGSGTRNRTQILLALFTAKKIAESEESARKTTPVVIIEEPECFLHPSAQAEFARVIRDLADEFAVQVIMTTHSPYMLSMKTPESNVLLRRKEVKMQLRQTERADTSGENWMQPFSQALGLESDEFEPWKRLFSAKGEKLLLVEGNIDKEYFEMLRSETHGPSRLCFDGEIVSYDGTGALANQVMLSFFQNRYKKIFVTFDLDNTHVVEKTLIRAGLKRDVDYVAIGVDAAGKRNIEGLLPDAIKSRVRERHPEIVDAAAHATGEEQKSARNKLKSEYLAEFKIAKEARQSLYGGFYPIVEKINRGFRAVRRAQQS